MKTQIGAKVVAHSRSPQGHEVATISATFPRFILAELNTHRMLSKNSASSRAIPFKRMVEAVMEDPFIPMAWQKDHTGMQGTEYFIDPMSIQFATSNWLTARDNAVKLASSLHGTDNGYESVTKQLCNRLLEPFMWHKVLVTATEWENFFKLRCLQLRSPVDRHFLHKSRKDMIAAHSNPENLTMMDKFSITDWLKYNESDAEIHISLLAEAMWDALNESTPVQLKAGEWHIPYKDQFEVPQILELSAKQLPAGSDVGEVLKRADAIAIKASTGKCARASYLTIGNEKEMTVEKLIGIHDKMAKADPFHASPFEHCARAMSDEEHEIYRKGYGNTSTPNIGGYMEQGWCRNFRGFIQYRHILETGGKI